MDFVVAGAEGDIEKVEMKAQDDLEPTHGFEVRGIEPVPIDRREKSAALANFTFWASANMVVSSFSLGTLGSSIFFLNFRDGLLVILFFNILGILPVAFFSTFGPKFGMRQMVLTRYTFGFYGTMLIGLFNIVACLGWSAVNVVVGGQVIHAINSQVPIEVGIVIIAVITTVVALFGYHYIHSYEKFAFVPMFVIFLIVLGESAKYWDTSVSGPSDVGSILSFAGAVYGFATGWSSYAADYNAYQPVDVPSFKVFTLTFLGNFIPLVFVELIGFGASLGGANNPDYATGLASGVGSFLGAVLSPLGVFGQILMVLLALSTVANNIPNDYSLGLTVQIFGDTFTKVKRYWWTLAGAIVYIAIAIPSVGRFNSALDNFLLLIGYWLAPYCSILAIEHLVFRGRDFKNYDLEAWDSPNKLPLGVAAVAALLVGIVGSVLGMAQSYYQGVAALAISMPFGADIGFELAAGFAVVVYLVLRPLELKWRKA